MVTIEQNWHLHLESQAIYNFYTLSTHTMDYFLTRSSGFQGASGYQTGSLGKIGVNYISNIKLKEYKYNNQYLYFYKGLFKNTKYHLSPLYI